MIEIGRSQTQIDDLDLPVDRPANRMNEHVGSGREIPVEDLDAEQIGARGLLPDGACDRRPVPQAVDAIVVLDECHIDTEGAGDAANVRMRGVDAGVDDGDAYAQSSQRRQRGMVQPDRQAHGRLPRGRRSWRALEQPRERSVGGLQSGRFPLLDDRGPIQHDRTIGLKRKIESM